MKWNKINSINIYFSLQILKKSCHSCHYVILSFNYLIFKILFVDIFIIDLYQELLTWQMTEWQKW